MSWWTNFKTFVNVGFLAGTDITVTKTFGDYESAASAQADVNRLSALFMILSPRLTFDISEFISFISADKS